MKRSYLVALVAALVLVFTLATFATGPAVAPAQAQSFKIPSSLKKYLPYIKKKKKRRRQRRRVRKAKPAPAVASHPERESQAQAQRADIPLPIRRPATLTATVTQAPPLPHPAPRSTSTIRTNARPAEKASSARKHSPARKPTSAAAQTVALVKPGWTEAEIKSARAACRRILRRVRAATIRMPPLREGACGTPAPIQLRAITSGTRVAIQPPATLNCQMIAALDQWLAQAQRTARRQLGADIVALQNVSGYSCRNRYNAAGRKISQHAFANALDIASFTLSDGRRISVKQGWGATRRELGGAPSPTPVTAPPVRKQVKDINSLIRQAAAQEGQTASWTGTDVAKKKGQRAEMAFLKTVHRQACQYFGTVLGPEANQAHRDHFHLDLAPRRRSNYCE